MLATCTRRMVAGQGLRGQSHRAAFGAQEWERIPVSVIARDEGEGRTATATSNRGQRNFGIAKGNQARFDHRSIVARVG
jgi:hypothetical protein